MHVTVGSAGAWLDADNYMPDKHWTVTHHNTYGFLNVRVENHTRMQVEFWGLKDPAAAVAAGAKDFSLMDSFDVLGFGGMLEEQGGPQELQAVYI